MCERECRERERERERDQASWDDVGRPAVYVWHTSHRAGRGGSGSDKELYSYIQHTTT